MTIPFKLRILGVLCVMMIVTLQTAASSQALGSEFKGVTSSALRQTVSDGTPTDQIIIKYKNPSTKAELPTNATQQAGEMAALSTVAGVRLTYYREMSGQAHVLKLPSALPESQVAQIARSLASLPNVEYAEPDRIMWPTAFEPNDPRFTDHWHYRETYGIRLPQAWSVIFQNSGTSNVVAVLDTGILRNHPDLGSNVLQGYDMISDATRARDSNGRDNDPNDEGNWHALGDCGLLPAQNSDWHGTHVAGTVIATPDNNVGVAGVAWYTSQLLPVRVLGRCGGHSSDIQDGIRWAAGLSVSGVPTNQNRARVINLSLGSRTAGSCSSEYQNAINDARNAGSVVVVAAGNANAVADYEPGNCNGVITVAATDRSGNRAPYSNYGANVEISAPGGDTSTKLDRSDGILSTLNDGTTTVNNNIYAFYQGTSMATPHVSGIVSMLLWLRPTLTPDQVLEVLQTEISPFSTSSTCNTSICGTGIANAEEVISVIHVNQNATGTESGLPSQPYRTLSQAYSSAWNGAKLKIQAGNYSGVTTLNKPITLDATGGLVTIVP